MSHFNEYGVLIFAFGNSCDTLHSQSWMCIRFNVLDFFEEREVEEALRVLELVCKGKVVAVGDHHESPSFDLLRLFEFLVLSFDKVLVLLVWIF